MLAHLVWSCGIEIDIVIVYDRRRPTSDLFCWTRPHHQLLLASRKARLSFVELDGLPLGWESETRLSDSLIECSTVNQEHLALRHHLPLLPRSTAFAAALLILLVIAPRRFGLRRMPGRERI